MRLPKILSVKLDHWLVLLIGLTFLLRIPSLFEPYWYGDEGIYLTVGQALRRGLLLYRDIYDNKPPLIYLVAALAQNQVWFRLILLWWNLINVYLIYRFAKLIFQKESLALAAGFLFIILSLAPEGNIANGEIFMIMPTTAAMLLLAKGLKLNTKSYFLAGVLFSVGFLFKVPAGFSFAAAVIFLVFEFLQGQTLRAARSDLHQKAMNLLFLIVGFSVLPLLTLIYFWQQGIINLYWQAAFKQNMGYLSSWQTGWNQSLISLSSGLTQRGLVLLFLIGLLFLLRKYFSKTFLLVILWFFMDLFGALLSGRPYPHYLIQAAPAGSLLLVFLIAKSKRLEKVFVGSSLGLLILVFFYYKFWYYPVWRYYQNFYQFVAGQETKTAYFSYFDSRANETYRLSRLIKSLTTAAEPIFIWGDEPYLYALSGRLPPGKYTVAYHIIDFNGWQETSLALEQKPPALIIKSKKARPWMKLEELLAGHYRLIADWDNTIVYRKI